jgi:hypothetical protein
VNVTVDGYTYRTTIGSLGGRSLISVSADVRGKAGVAAGDETARQAFDRLPYSHKSRYVLWVREAKKPETRQRRVDRTVSDLRGE